MELEVRFHTSVAALSGSVVLTKNAEFAHGQVDPHEAGAQGGKTSGSGGSDQQEGETYKPTEHGGQKKDGGVDGRVKQ